jgi:hypothetical protein
MAMSITKTLVMPIAKGITRCNLKIDASFLVFNFFFGDILSVRMDMPLEYRSKQVKKINPCISKSEMPTSMGISLFKMPTYDGKT